MRLTSDCERRSELPDTASLELESTRRSGLRFSGDVAHILRSLSLAALLLAAVPACSPLPVYDLSASWPHKDIALLRIELEEPLDSTRYLEIARREAGLLRLQARAEDVPLYRIHCEFVFPVDDKGKSRVIADLSLDADMEPIAEDPPYLTAR